MLFVLDHDVAATVGTVIRKAGHKCHAVGSAGLALASDDEVSVFAADRRGVLLTHDKELFSRRRKNTFGYHVLLKCAEWDAPQIVGDHIEEVIAMANTRDALCMALSKDGLKFYRNRWI